MPATDKRVDAYIAKSQDFAKPILTHLRQLIHKTCPDVQETIKWGFPNFEYSGSVICSMASFKQHCAFTFWLGKLMEDPHNILDNVGEKSAMGHLGKIQSLKDLPTNKIFASYIKQAMTLAEKGIKLPKADKSTAKEIETPDYFLKELKKNKTALATFEKFSPSHKKEYVEWITEAKTEATRNKRMTAAIEMMTEGKSRNWKYMSK